MKNKGIQKMNLMVLSIEQFIHDHVVMDGSSISIYSMVFADGFDTLFNRNVVMCRKL